MTVLLTGLLFFLAIALIILVLIQPDRSNGMSGSIGGGAANSVFGINEDGGPLAKITQVVATLFILNALALYLISR